MIATQQNSVIVHNPPRVSSGPLPPMYVGQPFTHTFTTADGEEPFGDWFVLSGTVPTGLSLNVTTGELAGTPTTAGPFDFTVARADANG